MGGTLDSDALARLAGLPLRVQTVVEGTLAGLHKSPHSGASVEFAEHKEYAPGDDPRHLDWKALARLDRCYIKRFEDETDLKAYLLLDASGSMGYGEPLCKYAYGATLLGSLAQLLVRQGDQAALMVFSDEVRGYLPPRSRAGHLRLLLELLEGTSPSGGTDLGRAVTQVSEMVARRSLVVVVSDLFDSSSDGLRMLRHLRARRHHVVLFHLLHADELTLPFRRLALFEAMEDSRQVLVDPAGIRDTYLREMARFRREVSDTCREGGVEFHTISTAWPLEQVLLAFLRRSPRIEP